MEWIFDEETSRFTSTRRIYACPAKIEIHQTHTGRRYPEGHHYYDHATLDVIHIREALLHHSVDEQFRCDYCGIAPLLWDQSMYRPYTLVPWTITEEP